MSCEIQRARPAFAATLQTKVGSIDSQKNAKGFGVGRRRLNRSLKPDPGSVEWAGKQFADDGAAFFFIRRVILHSEITIAVPHIDIISRDLHRKAVKLAVENVLRWIEAECVTHFSVRNR